MKKFIATILIIGMVLSLNLNLFLFKPKTAQALDAGGSWAQAIKDTVLDAIAWVISDMVLKPLEQKIMAWGQGKTSAGNVPFAITDYVQYFKDAVALGAAKWVNQEFANTFNEVDKFEKDIKNTLESIGITNYADLPTYSQYAKPTLKTDLGNDKYQKFVDSGYSLVVGGSDAWFSLLKPQNNILDQILMAQNAKQDAMDAQKEAADKQTATSGGYKNETATTQTDTGACEENCKTEYATGGGGENEACTMCQNGCNSGWDQCIASGLYDDCDARKETCLAGCTCEPESGNLESCLKNCQKKTSGSGIAIKTQIKNLGSDIHKQMENALGADMARVISADEISELIGILFSSLLNKAVNGLGLMFSPKTDTSTTRARAAIKDKYSSSSAFQAAQTEEQVKDIRSKILTGILKSIQQLDRSIIACDEDSMMKVGDYAKNLADILAANTEALYVGMEGINLQPDFEVLDPPYVPYTVYGYSYSEVPPNKFPEKCRKITNQYYTDKKQTINKNATCQDIKSGLEPSNDCNQCMYDDVVLNCPPAPYPPQPYPATNQPDPYQNSLGAKADFYNSCRGQYFDTTLTRCNDCLKKADEQCNQDDPTEKMHCIVDKCSDYKDLNDHVISPIKSGWDFYKKCLIAEQKEACVTCLKEYFMPPKYCEWINDYMSRAIVKYPAIVHVARSADLATVLGAGVYGGTIGAIFAWISGADDKGIFIGPVDPAIKNMGDECNDNYGAQSIDAALVCRIMPDFMYLGQPVCKTYCMNNGITQEELEDITDFRPWNIDCNNLRLPIGGHNPGEFISGGVLRVLGKCCATFWQHNMDNYKACVGSGATVSTPPPPPPLCLCGQGNPECCCAEGWRPVVLTRSGWTDEGRAPYGGDCVNAGFSLDSTYKYFMHMNNDDTTTDVAFIAAGGCSENDEILNNTDQLKIDPEVWPDDIGDGLPDVPPSEPDVTTFPSGVAWSHTGTPGEKAQFCIQNVASNNYIAGVYHNDNKDIDSGIQICQQCFETDTDYPYYGTPYNQCTGKPDPLEVPAECQ